MRHQYTWAAARLALALAFTGLSTQAAAQAAGDAVRGRAIYGRTCVACHGANGAGGAIAPRLVGVTGRRAGSTSFKYSPAMKNARIVWSPAALDNYLKSPMASIPGSRMPVGVEQAKDRGDLIAFLATLR